MLLSVAFHVPAMSLSHMHSTQRKKKNTQQDTPPDGAQIA